MDVLFCSVFIVYLIQCLVESKHDDSVIVDAPFGKIKGLIKQDESTGQGYLSFRGIPYAKPPVNELRFEKPQPHPNIDGVFDATKDDRIECPVPKFLRNQTYNDAWYTEDCLILNVEIKYSVAKNQQKKVMVFIHGGGYITGSSYMYQASSFVISEDVIMVTVNYRLGILGFLSTENEASPGNYGLWDQALAIKWVKDNIRAFGGDPDDITVSGESAGGSAVGYQSLSPHTKGLFTRAMLQSGTASSVFGLSFDALSDTITLATFVGCWEGDQPKGKLNTEQSKVILACLRSVSLSKITEFSGYSKTLYKNFRPRIDGDFVPDFPLKLLQDDSYLETIGFFDITYLIAVDNNEIGLFTFANERVKQTINLNNDLSEKDKELAYQAYAEKARHYQGSFRLKQLNAEKNMNAFRKIEEFYSRRYENDAALAELMSDVNILIPSLDFLFACSRRESCDSYFLYIDYFPHYMKHHRRGMLHAMDLIYWFDLNVKDISDWLKYKEKGQLSSEDLEIKNIFSSIIGEFTRSGHPGPSVDKFFSSGWPRFDLKTNQYLRLNTNPWISSFHEKDKQDFWIKTVPNIILKPKHEHSEL